MVLVVYQYCRIDPAPTVMDVTLSLASSGFQAWMPIAVWCVRTIQTRPRAPEGFAVVFGE